MYLFRLQNINLGQVTSILEKKWRTILFWIVFNCLSACMSENAKTRFWYFLTMMNYKEIFLETVFHNLLQAMFSRAFSFFCSWKKKKSSHFCYQTWNKPFSFLAKRKTLFPHSEVQNFVPWEPWICFQLFWWLVILNQLGDIKFCSVRTIVSQFAFNWLLWMRACLQFRNKTRTETEPKRAWHGSCWASTYSNLSRRVFFHSF